jgi:hypothetical protein
MVHITIIGGGFSNDQTKVSIRFHNARTNNITLCPVYPGSLDGSGIKVLCTFPAFPITNVIDNDNFTVGVLVDTFNESTNNPTVTLVAIPNITASSPRGGQASTLLTLTGNNFGSDA